MSPRVVGSVVILFILGLGAVYLLWTGFSESRTGPILGGLFVVALMAYTILATVGAEVRVRKGIPADDSRELRSLTFWLRFAAVVLIIVLAYGVWTGVPLAMDLLLVLNLSLVVAWLLVIRRASRA